MFECTSFVKVSFPAICSKYTNVKICQSSMAQMTKGIKRCLSKSPCQLHWFQWEVLCSHTRFQQPKQITRSLKHSQQVPYSICLCHTDLSCLPSSCTAAKETFSFFFCVDLYPRVGISRKIAAFCGHSLLPPIISNIQICFEFATVDPIPFIQVKPKIQWCDFTWTSSKSHSLQSSGPLTSALHEHEAGSTPSDTRIFRVKQPFNFLTFGEIPASRPACRIPSATIPEEPWPFKLLLRWFSKHLNLTRNRLC